MIRFAPPAGEVDRREGGERRLGNIEWGSKYPIAAATAAAGFMHGKGLNFGKWWLRRGGYSLEDRAISISALVI